jgi:N-carbamoyl-L-amino-acid hydrolase
LEIDPLGNLFFHRPGQNPASPAVLMGSHLDSQLTGGRFDGAYGVLAGLEVIRTLNDLDIVTKRPLQLVNWTNEEGVRFSPAMLGSGGFAGVYTDEYALARKDSSGESLAMALERSGYAGPARTTGRPGLHAAFELHIEQGPRLEAEGLTIGVVTGTQGIRWYDAEFRGESAHSGTTPLAKRRDAALGLAQAILAVREIGLQEGETGRATVGSARLFPNVRNAVTEKAVFTVEFRHPDQARLVAQGHKLKEHLAKIAKADQLGYSLKEILTLPPLTFDPGLLGVVRQACTRLRLPHCDILSGAGHDSCNVSRVAPTAMIFIPCRGGLSHNEAEDILPEWAEAGANVLLQAVLDQAQT